MKILFALGAAICAMFIGKEGAMAGPTLMFALASLDCIISEAVKND